MCEVAIRSTPFGESFVAMNDARKRLDSFRDAYKDAFENLFLERDPSTDIEAAINVLTVNADEYRQAVDILEDAAKDFHAKAVIHRAVLPPLIVRDELPGDIGEEAEHWIRGLSAAPIALIGVYDFIASNYAITVQRHVSLLKKEYAPKISALAAIDSPVLDLSLILNDFSLVNRQDDILRPHGIGLVLVIEDSWKTFLDVESS